VNALMVGRGGGWGSSDGAQAVTHGTTPTPALPTRGRECRRAQAMGQFAVPRAEC
jgi:hypothetical protein